MNAKIFTLQALLATVGAVAAGYYAIASIQLSGLLPSSWVATDVIRQRCSLRIVSPEWVSGSDQADILFAWAAAETRARLTLVGFLWIAAIAIFAWQDFHSRTYVPEETA